MPTWCATPPHHNFGAPTNLGTRHTRRLRHTRQLRLPRPAGERAGTRGCAHRGLRCPLLSLYPLHDALRSRSRETLDASAAHARRDKKQRLAYRGVPVDEGMGLWPSSAGVNTLDPHFGWNIAMHLALLGKEEILVRRRLPSDLRVCS